MERSFNELIRRHESLRTRMVLEDGEPVQSVTPAAPLALAFCDLSDFSPEQREFEAEILVDAEVKRSFQLDQSPLLRASLLRLTEEEHILIVHLHQMVSDAASLRNLARELTALYAAEISGKTSPLPLLPSRFADYALWEQKWLKSVAYPGQLSFWKTQLRGPLPVMTWPTNRVRPAKQSLRGAWLPIALPKTLISALKEMSRAAGVFLSTTLLAGFNVLMHACSGEADILVGTSVANRNKPEREQVIGSFSNTLVLRTHVSDEVTFRELMARVRAVTTAAQAHQDIPFAKLVEELKSERNLGTNPFFQVQFALQHPPANIQLAGLSVEPLSVDNGTSKLDLSFELWEADDAVAGRAEFNTDLFDAPRVSLLLGTYQKLLEAAAANPAQLVSSLCPRFHPKPADGREPSSIVINDRATSSAPTPLDVVLSSRVAPSQAPGAALIGQARPEVDGEFASPKTYVEKKLVEIWAQILQIQQIGILDNFFELGGHSLLVMRINSRVQAAFKIDLPVRTLFDAPTIAEFALIVEKQLFEEVETLSEEEAQRLSSSGDLAAKA